MPTSTVYRAPGICGCRHRSARLEHGLLYIRLVHDGAPLKCPHGGSAEVIRRGTVAKCWSPPPLGSKPVILFADVPRVQCRGCGNQPVVSVPFAAPRKSDTRSFERYMPALRECMTLQDVARLLRVSDWLVRDIEKRWLGRHFSRPRLKHPERIAIDEIATKKGHVYVTPALDLDSGAVVFVGKGPPAGRVAGDRRPAAATGRR